MSSPGGNGSIANDGVYVATDDILATEVDDERVVLDRETETYYGLNAVGAFLWERLEEPRTVEELEAATATEFDVTKAECRDDIHEFLIDLQEADLIERV